MPSMQCNDIWAPYPLSVFTATASALLSVITTIGNALIVIVVVKDPLKKLHTPFNYFVVNLAVSDLIVGLVNFPVSVYTHTIEAMGDLNEISANVFHMSFFISVTASIFSLIALSVDRWIAITFALKYRLYVTWKRCQITSVVIAVFSLSLSWIYLKVGFIDYLMVYANCGIVLAFIILLATYIRIYKYLRIQTQSLKQHMRTTSTAAKEFQQSRIAQEKKVTRVFLIVLMLFLCTYGPATVMIYILQYCKTCHCTLRHWLRDLEYLFIAMNSAMDPFVYTIRLKTFRKSIVKLFKNWKLFWTQRLRSQSTVTIISTSINLTQTISVPTVVSNSTHP